MTNMRVPKTVEIGEIVFSVAGRDSGRFYIVGGILDEKYVLIIDGVLRKISKPKKKKICHLRTEGVVIEKLKEKFNNNLKVFDAEVKSVLKMYNGSV